MEPHKFESEYEKVSERLYFFLLRLTGDRNVADEILQEAAYLAYRKRRQYRGEAPFSSWIYSIAINAWRKHRKIRGRELSMNDPEVNDLMLVSKERSPETLVSGHEAAARLSEVIDILDERYRAPFLLRHLEGLSYRDISEMLDINENAARVRTYRARHILRSALKEEEF